MTRRLPILAAITILAALALVAAGPAASRRPSALAADPPPANDNFASAFQRSGTPTLPWTETLSTTGATLEAVETAPCGSIGATVWFSFWSSQPATIEFSAAGSDFDTILAVYEPGDNFLPSPPGGSIRPIACSDDAGSRTSQLALSTERSKPYYIQVGGKDGATGTLNFSVRCVPYCLPENDNFSDATSAYVDARVPSTTLMTTTEHATLEAGEPRPCGNIGATVWYQVIPQSKSDITIDTAGSDFDTVLAVYGLPSEIYPSPPGTLTASQCNDDAIGRQSRLTVHTTAAYAPIYVQVGGANGATGALVLNVACDPACAPGNDDVASAWGAGAPWGDLTHTEVATTEPGEPEPCGHIGRTVWYLVQLAADARLAVDTSGSNFDTVVAVYRVNESPSGYTPAGNIGCSVSGATTKARAEFAAEANQPYLVQLGGKDGAAGELNVSIMCTPAACPPPGDSMEDAQILGGDTTLEIDTSGATVEPGETLNCGIVGATVWYHVQAAATLRIRLSTVDSNYPVAFAAYRWTTLSPPGGVAFAGCGDPAQPSTIELGPDPVFLEYLVQIGSTSGKGGALRLRAECISGGPCAHGDQPLAPEPPTDSPDGIADRPGLALGDITGPNTGSGGYLPGAR